MGTHKVYVVELKPSKDLIKAIDDELIRLHKYLMEEKEIKPEMIEWIKERIRFMQERLLLPSEIERVVDKYTDDDKVAV